MKAVFVFLISFSAFAGSVDIDANWDYDHPEISEAVFTKLANENKSDLDMYLQLRTQVARAQGLENEFKKANLTLGEVSMKLGPGMPVANIRYNLERGRVVNSSGQPIESLSYFKRAFELACAAHVDMLAIDALHMLGVAEVDIGKQLEWDAKALEFIAQSSDPHSRRWIIPVKSNMAYSYEDMKDYENALSTFEEIEAIYAKNGKGTPPDIVEEIDKLKKQTGKSHEG